MQLSSVIIDVGILFLLFGGLLEITCCSFSFALYVLAEALGIKIHDLPSSRCMLARFM